MRSEIQYHEENGSLIHSDLDDCDPLELRRHLHEALDEWFDCARGTGFFYVGDPDALSEHFAADDDERMSRVSERWRRGLS